MDIHFSIFQKVTEKVLSFEEISIFERDLTRFGFYRYQSHTDIEALKLEGTTYESCLITESLNHMGFKEFTLFVLFRVCNEKNFLNCNEKE